MLSQRTTQHE
ncbi:hypothetical protein CJF31_00002606 [Rutstroemia sp. NJR-2017a BVV2]|nr:hypothetical protein CJF31_00002606 [Rutstroemia sp. NJR-2017a BVV2]